MLGPAPASPAVGCSGPRRAPGAAQCSGPCRDELLPLLTQGRGRIHPATLPRAPWAQGLHPSPGVPKGSWAEPHTLYAPQSGLTLAQPERQLGHSLIRSSLQGQSPSHAPVPQTGREAPAGNCPGTECSQVSCDGCTIAPRPGTLSLHARV